MGGCTAGQKLKMSKILYEDLINAFSKLDSKANNRISIGQMDQYWTGPYSKTYTQVLFKQMDLDANGVISKNQWIAYWQIALRCGYSENEIRDCIKSIKDGSLKMQFSRIKTYEPQHNKTNMVQKIISDLDQQFA